MTGHEELGVDDFFERFPSVFEPDGLDIMYLEEQAEREDLQAMPPEADDNPAMILPELESSRSFYA
jgi:hypothetical protein